MEYLFSLAYLPPISYFAYILKGIKENKAIYIDGCENYIKQTFRNRTYIASNNGLQSLSIPIGSNFGNKINTKDIELSEHGNWRHQHINAIKTSYGSSPFFEYYEDDIIRVISQRQSSLWRLNIDLLEVLLRIIHINVDIITTREFIPIGDKVNDYRFSLSPKNNLQDSRIIEMKYYDTLGNRQESWLYKLSIIDLLFNMGPETILILQQAIKKTN